MRIRKALAAGAAVALARGDPLCGTYYAVASRANPTLPQTSFAGEYTGISLALQSTFLQRQETISAEPRHTIRTDAAAALSGITTVLRRG
jgi:hypothetical protein